MNGAAGPAAIEPPRASLPLIGCGEKCLRILRVHDDIGRARVVVDKQYFLPRLAAVDGFKNAALGVRTPEMSYCRDIDNVRVRRMDDDAADVARILQASIFPVQTAVDGL